MNELIGCRQAVILRGPPAVGKSCVSRFLVSKVPTAKVIDLDEGWSPHGGRRLQGEDRRYADLTASMKLLILELCSGEPYDWSSKGATRNPREWIGILQQEHREIQSFLLWTDYETWKKRLLSKVPAGDAGAEQFYRLFERDEWKHFAITAGVQEELIDTTTLTDEEVANRIWERIQAKKRQQCAAFAVSERLC